MQCCKKSLEFLNSADYVVIYYLLHLLKNDLFIDYFYYFVPNLKLNLKKVKEMSLLKSIKICLFIVIIMSRTDFVSGQPEKENLNLFDSWTE